MVVGIDDCGETDGCVFMALISSDLHSLGTVVRKIQNSSIAKAMIADVRFEVLEEQIGSLLENKGGSFKMTSTRPSFEDMFKTALVPSLFGVRWIKDLFTLLINKVRGRGVNCLARQLMSHHVSCARSILSPSPRSLLFTSGEARGPRR